MGNGWYETTKETKFVIGGDKVVTRDSIAGKSRNKREEVNGEMSLLHAGHVNDWR